MVLQNLKKHECNLLKYYRRKLIESYGKGSNSTTATNPHAPTPWCSTDKKGPKSFFDEFLANSSNKENSSDQSQRNIFRPGIKSGEVKKAPVQPANKFFPPSFFNSGSGNAKDTGIIVESPVSQEENSFANSPKSAVSVVLDRSPCQVIDSAQKEMKQKFIIEPDISETETPFRFHEANAAQQEESQQILTKLLGKSKGKKRNAFNSSLSPVRCTQLDNTGGLHKAGLASPPNFFNQPDVPDEQRLGRNRRKETRL